MVRAAALDDTDWYVRREAVRALAARWPGEQATADLLCVCVQRDQAPEVRGAALRWLAAGWRHLPATPELLRTVASDRTELSEVRMVAVAELAAGWPSGQTRGWLWGYADAANSDSRVRAAAVEALAAGWRDDNTRRWLRGHVESTAERQPRVRMAALRALAAGWPDEPDTAKLLKAKARSGGDDDPAVRQAAVEALAAGRAGEQRTARWLRDQVGTEPNDDVRCVMAQALATYWRDDATIGVLKMLATDRDRFVRAIAVRAVADIGGGQQHACAWLPGWLREQAAWDKNKAPYVRQVALSAAAVGWPGDRETEPWLRRRAADPREDPDVRGAALQALAAHWPNNDTLECLRSVGEGDARTTTVRQVAVRLVAFGWRTDPRTRSWLVKRATSDSSESVRRTALQLLAADAEWHAHPATIALLRETAVDDMSPAEVRRAAISILEAGWHDDPAIAGWLRRQFPTRG